LDDEQDDDSFYDLRENNLIDGYAGNFQIEDFVKSRQIDGDYWDSDVPIFYGLQLFYFLTLFI